MEGGEWFVLVLFGLVGFTAHRHGTGHMAPIRSKSISTFKSLNVFENIECVQKLI